MKLVSTPRIEFARVLATEILHNYGRGRTIVAVDGADERARARFADDLAAVFEEREHRAFRASLDSFRRSRDEQSFFGPESPERLYRHRYDFSLLRRVLLEPFRMDGGTGFVTEAFDRARDAWIEPTWLSGPPDATLILDGPFLNRRELRGLWSNSVLVETEADAEADDAEAARLYRTEVRPRERVSAVVDLTDPDRPRRLLLDGC